MNDPTMAAVGGVYTAMWNTYLNTELLFTSTSNSIDLNDQAFQYWDFSHTNPAGVVQKPDAQGNPTLYTAGDLAATMAANPDLLVLSANGYFDSVTPFYQTRLTLDAMPLQNAAARANLTVRNFPPATCLSDWDFRGPRSRPTSRRCTTAQPAPSSPGLNRMILRGAYHPDPDPPLFQIPRAGRGDTPRRGRRPSPGRSPTSAPPIRGRAAWPAAA